jgi:hypothetical protein
MNTPQPAHPDHPGRDAVSPAAPAEETWKLALRYAVRAPSGHNTQPWRFEINDGRLHLYADRSRRLPVVDPADRALVISCGAALGHLLVAVRHFGHAGEVTAFPDPGDHDLLATVGLGPARTPQPDDHQLFEAIDQRHTHRAAFGVAGVPETVLAHLAAETRRHGATLGVVTGENDQAALDGIADLVAEGDRAQFADADFRRELAAWMRPNRTRRPDGIPGHALGIADLPSVLAPRLIAAVNTGSTQARKDEQLARTAPALLLLSTADDTPADWLRAGHALALLLLRATADGLCASFLNQPIEVPALRVRLRDLVPDGPYPQLLLRIGYAPTDQPTVKATPRRTVADVLTDTAPTTGASL